MKRLVFIFGALMFFTLSHIVGASTIYLPTESSSQYLPTVKIFAYSLSYDGSLVGEAYGSGTLIDSKGTVLTNNHVIENYWEPDVANDAFQICLTKSNNPSEPVCEFTASLLARDPERDLALMRIDSTDVKGSSISFNFYLPYNNESDYGVGETVTVIGYPDTGGRTITYTSGLISGFISESGTRYIKTDADISFGNSGGTAVDEDGNFIGVPTYIVGSYSSEVLGYLYPVDEAVSWIGQNINNDPVRNEVADSQLKRTILANINANETGFYQHDYPPYSITVIDGWKFGNSLEGSFESDSFETYYGSENLVIHPVDRGEDSNLFVEVSVTDYAYNVTLDDIEYILDSNGDDYYFDFYEEEESEPLERVDFNGKYPAVKEVYSYYDWWYDQDITSVTYYIPYGDKVINVMYSYGDAEIDRLSEIEKIIGSFEVDMSKVVSSVVDVVESDDPLINVINPLNDAYLSDDSYEYDGVFYFGASYGKKRDYNFRVDIYSNEYWDDIYIGDFDLFKEDTLKDAEEWYDIISKGELKIDGHTGFYYTDEYEDYYYGSVSYYTTIYIEGSDDTYFTVYYSGDEDTYNGNMADFKLILQNIQFESGGAGQYLIPNFKGIYVGTELVDIKYHVYEDSIKNISDEGAFGESVPMRFNPAEVLTRKDYLIWAVRTLDGSAAEEFAAFEENYSGCGSVCFVDVDYNSDYAIYVDFAKTKGAVGGLNADGKYYFAPDSQVSLLAALKIIFELNDYDLWEAPSFVPWYIPYLQLGYKEGLVPYGVNEIGYVLNRAEGAYIIDGTLYGDYYDDYWY